MFNYARLGYMGAPHGGTVVFSHFTSDDFFNPALGVMYFSSDVHATKIPGLTCR